MLARALHLLLRGRPAAPRRTLMKLDWPPRILAAMLAMLAMLFTSAVTFAASYNPAPPTRMADAVQADPVA